MGVPISQMATVAGYILKQKLAGRKRYPLVLMLEPLYRCNLACAGCGKIQYPNNILKSQLSVDDCLRAVDECGTPIVSIPGGEPLLHPEISRLVEALVASKKYIYLCTNALLLESKLDEFRPSKFLSFSVHLDGLETEHDTAVCRPGTYETAVRAVRAALARGFRVTTNTTLFHGADASRTADFFDEMMRLGVEGMMVSPGYSYAAAPDQEHFLARSATHDLFRRIFRLGQARGARWRFNQSPLFLEFLAGQRDYDCSAWSMPSYSVFGWQKPCYLLQEGYARTYDELISDTKWECFGPRSGNPACRDCMVHSGFEASSVDEGFSSWRGFVAMARAALLGPRATNEVSPATSAATSVAAPAPRHPLEPAAGATLEATPDVLRAAFDFRGDVTLELSDGAQVVGFVADVRPNEIRVWPAGEQRATTVAAANVRRVIFSGRDETERVRDVARRGRERVEAPAA